MLPLFAFFRLFKFVPYLVRRMSLVRDSRAKALIELWEFTLFKLSLNDLLIILLLNYSAASVLKGGGGREKVFALSAVFCS
jgi:hypothetical protein